jgi:[acyl-carrier-protein] S-malonyltransferase
MAITDATVAQAICVQPVEAQAFAWSRALIFPGQGSQAVGMGKDLVRQFPSAAAVFGEVDDALGQRLFRLMTEGPEDELTLTENAQPALMALSMAILHVLQVEFGIEVTRLARFVAGHSLGEYTALTAAGSFSVGDAARLLRKRGLAMQTAVPVGEGAMAALIGADLAAATEIAEEATRDSYDGGVCVAANDNAPGQIVISGNRTAVERAIEIASLKGIKRSVLLPVSGPFHCPLMAPVADAMAEALAAVVVNAPIIPLVSNVTARPVSDPNTIRHLLVRQVTGMVRWRESCLYMHSQGIVELIEIGPGRVLSGLAKRIDRSLSGRSVDGPQGIEALVQAL